MVTELPKTMMHDANVKAARVVIVGAGITGYLTAITLSQKGFINITLMDALKDPTAFQRTRAYSQCVYQLGQRLLKEIPDLFATFKQRSLEQFERRVVSVSSSGEKASSVHKLPSSPVYWLLRADLMELLDEYISAKCPSVAIRNGTKMLDLQLDGPANSVMVSTGDSSTQKIPVDLLVACDGSYSFTRALARKYEGKFNSSSGFEMYQTLSPSVGMCPKGLRLSENIISAPGHPIETADPSTIYRFTSAPTKSGFDLLLLPVGSADSARARVATFCVKESHCIWQAHTVEEAYKIFESNFPQLRIRDLFSEVEMATFVSERPAPFTPIERPKSIVGTFKTNYVKQDKCGGIIFLGDAAHSFPPDTAQGVNSAMEDIRVLSHVIDEGISKGENLASMLETYEAKRNREIWALMELAKSASPCQYGQNWFGTVIENMNKSVRRNLSKLMPILFHPSADTLIRQDYDYSEVRRLSDATTRNILIGTFSLLAIPLAVLAQAN